MHFGPRFLLLLPLAALLGCGSSNSTLYNFNGEWDAIAIYSSPQYLPFTNLGGALHVSNGAVSGTLTASTNYMSGDPNLCAAVNTPLTVTGTLDAANNLSLTFPIAGGTGTLLATLANNPTTYAYGSWQIAGGTCPMSAILMAIKGTPTTPSPTTTSPSPITANLSGNWSAIPTYIPGSDSTTYPVTGFGGELQFSNGTVTGTVNAYSNSNNPLCMYNISGAATATGTLDANNNLTLSLPVAGGIATITATLSANPQTFADGIYHIFGGPCAMSATPLTIAQYAPVTGTYTGNFNIANSGDVPFSGTNITLTAVLTQSTTANASGQFPITGTINVTGACTDSATLAAGTVTGDGIYSKDVGTGNKPIGPGFLGASDPTASTIITALFYDASTSTNCSGNAWSFQGTLNRQ